MQADFLITVPSGESSALVGTYLRSCIVPSKRWTGARGETSLTIRQDKGTQGYHFHAIVNREVSFTAQHVLCRAKSNVINK